MLKYINASIAFSLFLLSFSCGSYADGFQSQPRELTYTERQINKQKELLGKTVWLYLDRKDCIDRSIYIAPNDKSDTYASSKPVKLYVDDLVFPYMALHGYYKVVIDDSIKAYLSVWSLDRVNSGGEDAGKSTLDSTPYKNDIYRLEHDCVFSIPPIELQSAIEALNTKSAQEIEANKVALEEQRQKYDEYLLKQQELVIKKQESDELLRITNEKSTLAAEDAERKQLPEILKTKTVWDICLAYGNANRMEPLDFTNLSGDLRAPVNKEASRRKLKLNIKLTLSRKVVLGMSECQLYASWGIPVKQNISTGKWGEHIQNYYGDNIGYVYTENGVVTSMQY